ncbi:Pentatricopeptide repeat-containing protein [Apostasia shenzhenica]|uniref:Pentatricopeptide repeat-containing protein n=1 Tax=Apostasia shenzhenica TaxID=1088818 RepID=A0A2H9ZQU7_9ASPA|nr:Pentatricopeptide repeat-containing protein [Apostasia shenzhenica]
MPLSRSFTAGSTPLQWRTAVSHRSVADRISSLLLHHTNAISRLRSKPSLLPHPLASSLLRRILIRTQSQPDVCLRFFLFARSHLSFSPDLPALSAIVSILVAGNYLSPAARLLSPALHSYSAPAVMDSLLRFPTNGSQSGLLSFLLELYSTLPSLCNALETFKRMKTAGAVPNTRSCNAFLGLLCSSGESRTAWSVFAGAMRMGAEMDDRSWDVLTELLFRDGKLQLCEMLLKCGLCRHSSSYELVVGGYSQIGMFRAAIRVMDMMKERGWRRRFSTLSSVLDGCCRFQDIKIAGLIIKEMVVWEFLPVVPSMDFGRIIASLCELRMTFAASFFFEKAQSKNFEIQRGSYVILLKALAQEGRIKQSMKVYDILSQRGVALDFDSLDVFVSGVCRGEPMEEVDAVIKSAIKEGIVPNISSFSSYLDSHCSRGRWKEATELLLVALDKVSVHKRMKELGGCFGLDSYNCLLEALVVWRRVEEALENVFKPKKFQRMMD